MHRHLFSGEPTGIGSSLEITQRPVREAAKSIPSNDEVENSEWMHLTTRLWCSVSAHFKDRGRLDTLRPINQLSPMRVVTVP